VAAISHAWISVHPYVSAAEIVLKISLVIVSINFNETTSFQ
jgi:hypothetical protein